MNIKTSFFLFTLLVGMQFFSCINKKNKTESNNGIKGHFVNNTFLEKLSFAIPDSIPFYCTEMDFFSADSVNITNGFEEYNRAYKKEGDYYLLLGASFKGNMPFILNQNGSITLIDTAWTNVSTNSEFKKVTKNSKRIFDYYLNEQLITGEYFLYKGGQSTQQKVIFMSDGHVTGLEKYTTYSICYSGDCVGSTIPPSNTICFSDNSRETTFAFKIDKKNKTLKMYNLSEGVKDIKGELAIKDMIFDLRQ